MRESPLEKAFSMAYHDSAYAGKGRSSREVQKSMLAVFFDGNKLALRDLPPPRPAEGEVLIRVLAAGICNTDLEILKGYMAFQGIPGHEFVGIVEEAPEARWLGRRVVGEINCGCSRCDYCLRGEKNHCPNRTVLGILGRNGAFAPYIVLPQENLYPLPDPIPPEHGVFVEPLAAACRILEQVTIPSGIPVAVLGDGKLGLLIAQVIAGTGADLLVVGRSPRKLAILNDLGVRTCLAPDLEEKGFHTVIEATGSGEGLPMALSILRPRGTLVLKSTLAGRREIDMAPFVIQEITLVGSRCGPFEKALDLLNTGAIVVEPLISARYPLGKAREALEHAMRPDAIKVILEIPDIAKA
jgi:threonine dehydrogenase-like Zn-dependent dehydrogenase